MYVKKHLSIFSRSLDFGAVRIIRCKVEQRRRWRTNTNIYHKKGCVFFSALFTIRHIIVISHAVRVICYCIVELAQSHARARECVSKRSTSTAMVTATAQMRNSAAEKELLHYFLKINKKKRIVQIATLVCGGMRMVDGVKGAWKRYAQKRCASLWIWWCMHTANT